MYGGGCAELVKFAQDCQHDPDPCHVVPVLGLVPVPVLKPLESALNARISLQVFHLLGDVS